MVSVKTTTSTLLGVGHDIADIADIEAQLAEPGTRFGELFSSRERRQARRKAEAKADSEGRHLAACWAGKECVVKAWTEALEEAAFPLSLDEFEWKKIEILSNSKGCPAVILSSDYATILRSSVGIDVADTSSRLEWKISLTHSRSLASGVALLSCEEVLSI
jgi:holo-[acyl-carrier protein] synthase